MTIRYHLRHQILQQPVPEEMESHDYRLDCFIIKSSSVFPIILWTGGTIMLISLTYQAFKSLAFRKEQNENIREIKGCSVKDPSLVSL